MERDDIELTVQGSIQTCRTNSSADLYCKFGFYYEGDWKIISGYCTSITQTCHIEGVKCAYINYPINISFKGENPFGWPQFIIAVYGFNHFGNDTCIGYGGIHIPTQAGHHVLDIPLFTTRSTSLFDKCIQFFTGLGPELFQTSVIAQNQGRETLFTSSGGSVRIELNVVLSDSSSLDLQL